MTAALIAVVGDEGARLAAHLARNGIDVVGVVPAHEAAASGLLDVADALVLRATRHTLTRALVAACDRAGVRVVPLCGTDAEIRLAAAFGLAALPADADGWTVLDSLTGPGAGAVAAVPDEGRPRGQVVAVWGPAGAPGRSTLAIEIAAELSRGRQHVCIADADTHAPALALMLGLADEGPGFPAACRHAERGELDHAELERIATPVGVGDGRIDVLTGINRPGRWPELSERRVAGALEACHSWAGHTVVDVASSLERDEEIVSDLTDGPRRNAATLSAVRAADRVVAVLGADPLGVARFLRAYAELRAAIGTTPVTVVANRLRPGTFGLDAHGQIRRTLERFAGIRDVWFVPQDPRSVDGALLAARPVAETAPRSPLTLAVRRLVAESIAPPVRPVAATRRRLWRAGRIAADPVIAP
jgi:MinD-like ATPase involved in chromosome partitioning or flagellar assembly